MLSRKIPKLKLDLKSKVRSRYILLHKYLLPGIPVLSIFALVGIVSLSVMLPSNNLTRLFGIDKLLGIDKLFGLDSLLEDGNKAYAEEGITPLADTSASLTVDDGKIKDTIFATSGEFAYASHKVNVTATNIKSYTLTLSKTTSLTGPSTVNNANAVNANDMDNQWGYAWIDETTNPKDDTVKYYAVTDSTTVANNDNIDSSHNVDYSKQLVFGAKFGNSAASGTYHAEATLSLVATPRVVTNYVVNVNCNSGNGCTSGLNISSDAESYVYTISSSAPTRGSYTFLGYNTTNNATADTNYAPGKTITLTTANPTLTLYAVWQAPPFNGITTMQSMNTTICKNANIGDTATLTDTRGNATYTIRKHEDGKCWMTQNLRLVGSRSLTASDSNVNSSWTINAASSTSLATGYASNAVYYTGNIDLGALYTWYTATAGTGTRTETIAETSVSICPRNWYLPSRSDHKTLVSAIASANSNASGAKLSEIMRNDTYKYQYSGHIYNTSFVGGSGLYWSRTNYNADRAYVLEINDATANPDSNGGNGKDNGFAVRCVAYSS